MNLNNYNIFENVVDYSYQSNKGPIIINTNNNNNNNNNNFKNEKSYYYIIDSPLSPALAHLVYESFIFIKILIDLNKTNNKIKILTKTNKRFLKNLLKFFNIDNEIVYNIDNHNNYVYSHYIYSLHYNNIDVSTDIYYNYHLNFYINYIKNNIINLSLNNKILFLPRNEFDNFFGNDRKINNTDIIKNIVVNKGGVVLDTYHLNNFKYQFSIINDAKIIILDFGSSVFLNCIFLENKYIYILDDCNAYKEQINKDTFPYKYHIINNIICKNNTVKIIKTTDLDLINQL